MLMDAPVDIQNTLARAGKLCKENVFPSENVNTATNTGIQVVARALVTDFPLVTD